MDSKQYHYNAFISYNHNSRDSAIVTRLQQKLEHYHVPKDLLEKKDVRPIERIFVDKGELEATGDLSWNISNALENSDYLIVICSPEGKKSIWVEKEIEYFLRSHTLDKVLTVITEGEPNEVIPNNLLTREEEQEDGSIVTVMHEPLSCDYRLGLKQADREELPRLASVLMGCRYDDLVKRQEQYRRKKRRTIAAAASVIVCIAMSYLLWSNHAISKNYNNTLREQSESLALQSQRALSEGDRIGAIEKALEALPSEGNKRPVVAKAVRALSDSLLLYNTPAAEDLTAYRRYEGTGRSHNKICSGDRNGKVYFAELYAGNDKYEGGDVRIWDTESGKEILAEYTRTLKNGKEDLRVRNCGFTADGRILLITASHVIVADPDSETIENDTSIEGEYIISGEAVDYTEYSTLSEDLAIHENTLWLPVFVSDDGINYHSNILKIDINNGQIKDTIHDISVFPTKVCVSPDGRYLAFYESPWLYVEARKNTDIFLIDTETGSRYSVNAGTYLTDIGFGNDNMLFAAGLDVKPEEVDLSSLPMVDHDSNGKRMLIKYTAVKKISFLRIDAGTGERVWAESLSERFSGLPRIQFVTSEYGDVVCFLAGNNVWTLNQEGSGLSEKYDMGSYIVTMLSGNGKTAAILADGNYAMIDDTHDNAIVSHPAFRSIVLDATLNNGRYILLIQDPGADTAESRVIEYSVGGIDERYKDLNKKAVDVLSNTNLSKADIQIHGDSFYETYTVNENGKGNSGLWTARRSLKDGSVLWNKQITETKARNGGDYVPAGMLHDTNTEIFVAPGGDSLSIASLDTESGETAALELPLSSFTDTEGNNTDYVSYDPVFMHSKPVVDVSDNKIMVAVVFTRKDGSRVAGLMVAFPAEDKYYALGLNTEIEPGITLDGSMFIDAENTKFAIVMDSNKLITDDLSTEELDFTVNSMGVAPNGDTLLWENKRKDTAVHVFDKKSGNEKGVIRMGTDLPAESQKVECIELEDGRLLISNGTSAAVVDTDSWSACSVIKGTYRGYDPETKQFLLGSVEDDELGLVPYRSLEDMIKEGNQLLGNE